MTTAILLVEARGQSVHCREDACVNLVQAAWLARELARAGVDVRLRLIADAGQSIEEYSILCHSKEDAEQLKERILTAADPRETRYGVVRELRTRLPFTLRAVPAGGIAIEDGLFYSPLLATIDGANSELLDLVRDAVHPLFDPAAIDELEMLIAAHAGKPYLDLDLAVAQRTIAIVTGDEFAAIDIATVSRPEDDPRHWLHEGAGRTLIENDLLRKQGGESGGFHDRLIGVFASVTPNGEERPYFNSPTCCRVEHGKVRLIARDRFNVLGLAASERMTFDRFRELLDAQNAGAAERLLAIKYPHTARFVAASIADEANAAADDGPVHVMFIDGIGGWNPTTAGQIDVELRASLPEPITYNHITARDLYHELPPFAGGVLPVVNALAANPPSLFESSGLAESLLQSVIERVVPATSSFHS
ncbi:MAG TPA: hypothetical protein VGQ46_15385 [Thermoanaerobaculia bacterium]|jgi:hypothetical protein|nr:hypothetical protein [Thermoanaerobaculia bacterium]